MSIAKRPIGIFYEHPAWFKPLFKELEKRRIPFVRIHAANHQYNPAEREVPYNLVVNRVSSSAYLRGNSQGVFHSANYLSHVERLGVSVINGTAAQEIESSKAKQLELLASLGLPFPKTRIINHVNQILPAALALRFPIVIKVNLSGSVSSVLRFGSISNLQKAIDLHQISLGNDHTALVQEYIPAKDNTIVRIETLNGKFLYAVKIHTRSESFNLRPTELTYGSTNHWSVENSKNSIRVEAYSPSQKIVEDALRIAKAAHLDTGAIEYVTSAVNDQLYFCNIIALSNFVNDPINVLGFDPNVHFVDYIEERMRPIYEHEPIPVL
jgi:glutathione synthase/RimK-type ligase-like ATP-grasp enzyme